MSLLIKSGGGFPAYSPYNNIRAEETNDSDTAPMDVAFDAEERVTNPIGDSPSHTLVSLNAFRPQLEMDAQRRPRCALALFQTEGELAAVHAQRRMEAQYYLSFDMPAQINVLHTEIASLYDQRDESFSRERMQVFVVLIEKIARGWGDHKFVSGFSEQFDLRFKPVLEGLKETLTRTRIVELERILQGVRYTRSMENGIWPVHLQHLLSSDTELRQLKENGVQDRAWLDILQSTLNLSDYNLSARRAHAGAPPQGVLACRFLNEMFDRYIQRINAEANGL